MELLRTIPTVRIFDEAKAREFYVDFLGFEVVFEHRYGDDFPIYMEVKRGEVVFHLSEHHGDGVPGMALLIQMKGVDELQQELAAKGYKYSKPGPPEDTDYGTRQLAIGDPFGNKLTFFENVPS